MSDSHGEIIDLAAHRGNFRSIGEITKRVVDDAFARMSPEDQRAALREANRQRKVALRLLEQAQQLNVIAKLRGGAPSPALARLQTAAVTALDAARDYRNALTQTVMTLRAAIAANGSIDPTPAA